MSSSGGQSIMWKSGRWDGAGSDSMSDSGGGAGAGVARGDGDGEFSQRAAAALGLAPEDLFEDRVRVDRGQLEKLIVGEDESCENAQAFFDRVEKQTGTKILWPSHLKIGSRSRKSPHVHIVGLMDNVVEAKKEVMAVLDSPDNRVTMKMDVSYLYHSHIIGRGGLVIKQVMEETGTHIHFPDSNRNSVTEKSSQVSLTGKMSSVEAARQRVRNLMPLVFQFDAPARGETGGETPDATSTYVLQLQQQFHVQVRLRERHRLNGVQVQVKGSELEVTRVTEATLYLIRYFCSKATAADKVSVYTTLEIPPHHQPLVLGVNCSNIKMIMKLTGTQIMVPDLNDPNIPPIKKNVITIQGPIRNVYLARQNLLGSLPILLLFELSEYTPVDFNNVAKIMYDLDVQISFRYKEKQKTIAVSIKGIERHATNVYEARRLILGLEGDHRVIAKIPPTYLVPQELPVFRGANRAYVGRLPPPSRALPPSRSPEAEADADPAEELPAPWGSKYNQLTRNISAMLCQQAAPGTATGSAASTAPASTYSAASTAPTSTYSAASTAPASTYSAASAASASSRATTPALTVDSESAASASVPATTGATAAAAASQTTLLVASWLSKSLGRTSPTAPPVSPATSPSRHSAASTASNSSSLLVPGPEPAAAAPDDLPSLDDLAAAAAIAAETLGDAGAGAEAGLQGGPACPAGLPDMQRCPDRRAPGYERKSRELASASTAYDYRRQLALAYKAMQEAPVAREARVPTPAWSGMGFSRSSPVSFPAPPGPLPPPTPPAMCGGGAGGGGPQSPVRQAPGAVLPLWRSSPAPLGLRGSAVGSPALWGGNNNAGGGNGNDNAAGGNSNAGGGSGNEVLWLPDTTSPHCPPPTDVIELLASLGLHKYIDLFQQEEIDLQAFLTLNERDMVEIGITAVGARRRMLLAISGLKVGHSYFGHGPGSSDLAGCDRSHMK